MERIDPTAENLARIAYAGYGNNRGWVVASGAPMPRWEDQKPEFRAAWTAGLADVLTFLRDSASIR
jgi:hypothetical protein